VAEQPAQERTEQATPRRREEARREGKVARSQELSSMLILFCGVTAMYFVMPSTINRLGEFSVWIFESAAQHAVSATSFTTYFTHAMTTFALATGPIVLVVAIVGLGVNLAQVGLIITAKPLEPNLDKLNFAKGIQKLISTRTVYELAKDILKLALIGVVGYYAVMSEMKSVPALADMSVPQILSFSGAAMFRVAIKCCLILAVLSIIDYAYQKWDYEKSLRMSRQEIKEEMKNTEGDPAIKARIRQIQRQAAFSRMMGDVPKADVVVTNPTHIAIALRYDVETMSAPTVIAKGQRLVAERIKEIATEHEIPIVENKPLAQALFKACEIGTEIPSSLFRAVAEVLAYVYRLKGKH
jgi:flagellar biosynthetic protein FlhB